MRPRFAKSRREERRRRKDFSLWVVVVVIVIVIVIVIDGDGDGGDGWPTPPPPAAAEPPSMTTSRATFRGTIATACMAESRNEVRPGIWLRVDVVMFPPVVVDILPMNRIHSGLADIMRIDTVQLFTYSLIMGGQLAP